MVETESISNAVHEYQEPPIKKDKVYPQKQSVEFPAKQPPGKIAECAFVYLRKGMGYVNTYYALLEDGTVWWWSPPPASEFPPILSLFVRPSIGLLLGVIVDVLLMWLQMKKRKQSSRTQS